MKDSFNNILSVYGTTCEADKAADSEFGREMGLPNATIMILDELIET